jgi:hypothetical protein
MEFCDDDFQNFVNFQCFAYFPQLFNHSLQNFKGKLLPVWESLPQLFSSFIGTKVSWVLIAGIRCYCQYWGLTLRSNFCQKHIFTDKIWENFAENCNSCISQGLLFIDFVSSWTFRGLRKPGNTNEDFEIYASVGEHLGWFEIVIRWEVWIRRFRNRYGVWSKAFKTSFINHSLN